MKINKNSYEENNFMRFTTEMMRYFFNFDLSLNLDGVVVKIPLGSQIQVALGIIHLVRTHTGFSGNF